MVENNLCSGRLTAILLVLFIISVSMPLSAAGGSEPEIAYSDTVTVVDQLGRQVVVNKNPRRIVSSYYITTAMLIALQVDNNLVAIEMKADSRPLYQKSAPHLLTLPAVGSGKTINVEACLELAADLVIIPYRLAEFIPRFEEIGIPVVAVKPETLPLFMETVALLGEVTGSQARAGEFSAYYEQNIAEVERLTADINERPPVYIAGSKDPLQTVTRNMYQHDMIHLAGGRNVSDSLNDNYWTIVSPERLLDWRPDYIFMVNYAVYQPQLILEDERLAAVPAVDNRAVARFPSSIEPWDYPTPSSLLGILWLTNRLHPRLYPFAAYRQTAVEFYQRFFNIEVADSEIGL